MLFLQVVLCSIGLDYSTLTIASSTDTTTLTKVKNDCVMFSNGTYSLGSKHKYSIKANNTYEFTLEELKQRNEIIEEIDGDFFKLKGYEVTLNRNTLNTLYFNLLNFSQPNLYVSLYDYLNPNELYNDVRLVFPHSLKSVVNESLAHASYVALKNKEKKIICVNLRGSKAVISEYEFDWLNKENSTEENKLINENKTENALNEKTEDHSNDKEKDKPKNKEIKSNDKEIKVKLVNRIISDELMCDKKIYDYFGEHILEKVNEYTKETLKENKSEEDEFKITNLNIEDLKKDFFDSLKKNKTFFEPLDLRIDGKNLEKYKKFKINLVEFYEGIRQKLMDEFVKFKSNFSEIWYDESVKVSVMSSFSEFVFFKFDFSDLWLESEEPFQEFSICKGLVILNKVQHEPNSFIKTVNNFQKFSDDCYANTKLSGVENEKFSSDNKYLSSFQEFLKSGNKKQAVEYLELVRNEEYVMKNKEPGRRIQAFSELKTQLAMFNTLPKEVQEMAVDKFNEVKEWYDNNNKKDVRSEVIYGYYDKLVGTIDYCTKRYLEEKKKKELKEKEVIKEEKKTEETKPEETKPEEKKTEEKKEEDTKLEEEKKKFDKLLNNDLFNKTFYNNGMFDKEMFNEFMKNEKLFNEEMEEKENPKEEL